MKTLIAYLVVGAVAVMMVTSCVEMKPLEQQVNARVELLNQL